MRSEFFLAILFTLSTSTVSAIEPTELATAFQHLVDVNSRWALHEDEAPKMNVQFTNDNERIKFHLQNVITRIREGQPSESKAELLSALWKYAEGQRFPINLLHQRRHPYFIDHMGTHCAVGYLMKESGHGALARKIQNDHNYDYVKDINTGGVLDWATQLNFSVEELAWIQPGYVAPTAFEPVPGEVNGPIKDVVATSNPDRLYILGDFDSISGQPCNGLAVFNGFEMECLNLGIEGNITGIQKFGNTLFVLGDLTVGNARYPMVVVDTAFALNLWSIPERPEAIGVARGGWTITSRLAIENPSDSNKVEIWEHDFINQSWLQRATVYGEVSGIGTNGTFVYGDFDSAHVTSQYGLDTSFAADNFFHFNAQEVYANTTPNCDRINTILTNGSSTYLGGYSDSGPILFRFLNETIQPLIFGDSASVNDLAEYGNSELIIGGDFPVSENLVGYFGTNLGIYNQASNGFAALGNFDRPTNDVTFFQDQWYIGGAFTDVSYNADAYLVRISQNVGINSPQKPTLRIFPNPANDFIAVSLDTKWKKDVIMQIHSFSGQLVLQTKVSRVEERIAIDRISAGTYVVTVNDGINRSSSVLIKQ